MSNQNLLTKKCSGPDRFTGEFFQTFKELIAIFKLFQNTEEEGTLPNSPYEATITLMPKTNKDPTKKKITYRPESFMNSDVKVLNSIPGEFSSILKGQTLQPSRINSQNETTVPCMKTDQYNTPYSKKPCTIISIDAEKKH